MKRKKKRAKRVLSVILILLSLAVLGTIVAYRFIGGKPAEGIVSTPKATETPKTTEKTTQAEPAAEVTPEPTPTYEQIGEDEIEITEIMVKNKTTICDDNGNYHDWVEIRNTSNRSMNLEGCVLSDGKNSWIFPSLELGAGEYEVIFAGAGDEGTDLSALMTGFGLGSEETVTLYTPQEKIADEVLCPDSEADVSYAKNEDGVFAETIYITPGAENTMASYIRYQESRAPQGPVIISEVVTSSFENYHNEKADDYPDWVELTNISDAPVSLSGMYLTNGTGTLDKYALPDVTIQPGEYYVVLCSEEYEAFDTNPLAPFNLNSENAHVLLTDGTEVLDCVSAIDVPYKGSVGRVADQNGVFFFTKQTPKAANSEGYRYICDRPEAAEADGVFNDVESVTVTLSCKAGEVMYYTTNGSLPTRESTPYDGPIVLTETTTVRAIASDGTGLDSRPVTLNYILNEGFTLPVLSVVSDDPSALAYMYRCGLDGIELFGNLSFYEEGGSFSQDCGIRMAGNATLQNEYKKNFTAKFRGAYGDKDLDYDLFGTDVTSYTSLTIRGGQDYSRAIIRNELLEDLCLQTTDNVFSQHSRFCIVYVNGEYYGIYALKEKIKEQLISDYTGLDKDSITIYNGPAVPKEDFYNQVAYPIIYGDIASDEVYDQVCEYIDMASFIDWYIMEGYSGNVDILYNNVRFWRSTDPNSDGKWRAIYFDLDAGFRFLGNHFYNITYMSYQENQYAQMFSNLRQNEKFKDQFLTRLAEVFKTSLQDQKVLDYINSMYAAIEPDVPRNLTRWNIPVYSYTSNKADVLSIFANLDYSESCINKMVDYFKVTEEERAYYFGS